MNIFKSKVDETAIALSNLQEQFETLNTQYADLQEQLKNVSEMSVTYKEEFERVNLENKDLKEKLEGLNQEVAEVVQEAVAVEELASLKAVEIIAEAGHSQVEVLEDEETDAIDTKQIMKTLKDLKGKELAKFYNDNKKAIFGALKSDK